MKEGNDLAHLHREKKIAQMSKYTFVSMHRMIYDVYLIFNWRVSLEYMNE
jgi:hypothetical protein